MGLSRLDSKKSQTILQHKSHISKLHSPIISDETNDDNKEVDEYGELVVKRLKEVHKKFSQEEIDKMAVAYESGATTSKIAGEFGCCKNTVNKLLKRRGINVTRSRALAKLDIDIVISMYGEMHTAEEIAKHFKVNPQVITKCLKEHGVKLRSRWDYYRG